MIFRATAFLGVFVFLCASTASAEPVLVPLNSEIMQGERVYVPLIGGPAKGKIDWKVSENLKVVSSSLKGAKVEGLAVGAGSVTASFNSQSVSAKLTVKPLVGVKRDKAVRHVRKKGVGLPDPKLKSLLDKYKTRLEAMNLANKFDRQADPNVEKKAPLVEAHQAALQRMSEDFLRDLHAEGSSLQELQRFRDRFMANSEGGNSLFPGEQHWDSEYLATERALMYGRALFFDNLLKDTIRETFERNPDACLIGRIDIGSWVNLDLAGLTFPGDIDASTVAVDPDFNVETRNNFEQKLVNQIGLDMIEADTVLTAHGQARADVFIGHWGKAFAELDMLKRSSWKQIVPVIENGKVVDIKMKPRPGKDLFWEVALRRHEEAVRSGLDRGPEVEFPKMDLTKEPMLSMEMLRHGIHDVQHGPYSRGQQMIKMLKYVERSYYMNKKAVTEFEWNPFKANDPALAKLASAVVTNKKDPARVSELISEFADTIPEFAGKPITEDNIHALTDAIIARSKIAMHNNAVRSLAFRLNKLAAIEDETTRQAELERMWTDLDLEVQEFRRSGGSEPEVMSQALDLVRRVQSGELDPNTLKTRSAELHRLLNDSLKLSEETANRIIFMDSYTKLKSYFRKKLGWLPKNIDAFVLQARKKYPNGAEVYDAVKKFNDRCAESTQGSAMISAADWADNAFTVYDAYMSGTDEIDALKKSCLAISEIALTEKFPGLQIPLAAYRSVSQGDPKPLAMAIGFKLFPTVGQIYMASTVLERVDSLAHDASFYDELNTMLQNTEFNEEGKIIAFKTKRHSEDVTPPGNRKRIVEIFSDSVSPFYTSTAFRYWRNMAPTKHDQFGLYEKKLEKLRRVFPTHENLKRITLLLQTYRAKPLDQSDKHYDLRVKQLQKWEDQIAKFIWTAMADSLEAAVVAVSARSEWEKELEKLEDKLSASDIYLGRKKGLRSKAAFEISKHGSMFTGENQYVIAPIYKKFIANYQAVLKIRLAIIHDLWIANFGIDLYSDNPPLKRHILTGSDRAAPRLTGDPDVDLETAKATFAAHKKMALKIKKDLQDALGRRLDSNKDQEHIKALGQIGFEMEHLRDDCLERSSVNCAEDVVSAYTERRRAYEAYIKKLQQVEIEIQGPSAAEVKTPIMLRTLVTVGNEDIKNNLVFVWSTSDGAIVTTSIDENRKTDQLSESESAESYKSDTASFTAMEPGKYAVVVIAKDAGRAGRPTVAEGNQLIVVKEPKEGAEEAKPTPEPDADSAADNAEIARQAGAAAGVIDTSDNKSGATAGAAAVPDVGTEAGSVSGGKTGIDGLIDAIKTVADKAIDKGSDLAEGKKHSDKPAEIGTIDIGSVLGTGGQVSKGAETADAAKGSSADRGVKQEAEGASSSSIQPDSGTAVDEPSKNSEVEGVGEDAQQSSDSGKYSTSGKAEISAPAMVTSGDVFTATVKLPPGNKSKYFTWFPPPAGFANYPERLNDKSKMHPQTVRISVPFSTAVHPKEYHYRDPNDNYFDLSVDGWDESMYQSARAKIVIPIKSVILDVSLPKDWEKESTPSELKASYGFHEEMKWYTGRSAGVSVRWWTGCPHDDLLYGYAQGKSLNHSLSAAGRSGKAHKSSIIEGTADYGARLYYEQKLRGYVGSNDNYICIEIDAFGNTPANKEIAKEQKEWLNSKVPEMFDLGLQVAQSVGLYPVGTTPPPFKGYNAGGSSSSSSAKAQETPTATPTPTPTPEEDFGPFSVSGVPGNPVFGSKARIALKTQGKAPASMRVIWSASQPGIEFSSPEGINTTVTFGRMGPVKIWAQVVNNKDKKTVGETPQAGATVKAPAFNISFSSSDPRVGQEVRATITSSSPLPSDLASWYWMSPASSNRMEYNDQASQIGFTLRDTAPLTLKAEARVKHYNDIIGTASASIQAKSYSLKVSAKKRGVPAMVWDPVAKGLVQAKPNTYYTGEQFSLNAVLEGGPVPSDIRWKWTVNDGVTISNAISQTPTVSRSEAGSVSAEVTATDKDKVVLATGRISLSVLEPPRVPTKTAPDRGSQEPEHPGVADKTAKKADELMERGGKKEKAGDLQGARDDYQKAREILKGALGSGSPEAKATAPDKLDEQETSSADQESAGDQEAQKREAAMTLIKTGREKEKAGELENALTDYEQAQAVLGNPRLADKIAEIKQAIANKAAQTKQPPAAIEPPAPTSTPTASEPTEDSGTSAMDLVKSGREKERNGDFAGALRDYQEAQKTLNNSRLADKISQLKNQVAPAPIPKPAATPALPPQKPKTEAINNAGSVQNGPQKPATFTFPAAVKLLFISTYHWNYGKGTSSPGTITLRHSDGSHYGPWRTRGRAGQGGVPNAYWETNPNAQLKAGTYTVIDSDNSTWATNASADWKGMVTIRTGPPDYPDESSDLEPKAAIPSSAQSKTGSPTELTGSWVLNANNYKGTLEFSGPPGSEKGILTIERGPETLRNIKFDGSTLSFTRYIPPSTQEYTGKVSGSAGKWHVEGTFTQQGTQRVYKWFADMKGQIAGSNKADSKQSSRSLPSSAQSKTGSPTELAGSWALNANNYKGTLEFSGPPGSEKGILTIGRGPETLQNIKFDGKTLRFTRPLSVSTQEYTGEVSGSAGKWHVEGTFTQQGTNKVYKWFADMKGHIADSNKAASKQSSAPFADSTEPVSMPACGGKRFKLVVVPEGINYGHARASAEMAGGRLAVIRCAEENALAAKAAMSDDKAWFIDNYGNGIGPWLGGFQKNPGGPRNESWTWVSGEPFSYTNWDVNQPDNAHQGEDHLQFFGTNKLKSPFWNDIGGNAAVKGYIVEFAKSATP